MKEKHRVPRTNNSGLDLGLGSRKASRKPLVGNIYVFVPRASLCLAHRSFLAHVCGATKECFLSPLHHSLHHLLLPFSHKHPHLCSQSQILLYPNKYQPCSRITSGCPSLLPRKWCGHPLDQPEKKAVSSRRAKDPPPSYSDTCQHSPSTCVVGWLTFQPRLVREAPAVQASLGQCAGNLDLPTANSSFRIIHFQGKKQLSTIRA